MTQGPTSSAILASIIGCKSLAMTCAKDPLNKFKDSVNVLQSSPFELVGLPLEIISAASLVKGVRDDHIWVWLAFC
jgi:hypothetical protein